MHLYSDGHGEKQECDFIVVSKYSIAICAVTCGASCRSTIAFHCLLLH